MRTWVWLTVLVGLPVLGAGLWWASLLTSAYLLEDDIHRRLLPTLLFYVPLVLPALVSGAFLRRRSMRLTGKVALCLATPLITVGSCIVSFGVVLALSGPTACGGGRIYC